MVARQVWTAVVLPLCFVIRAAAAVVYVDVNSTNPVAPYVDWSTAATNIQDAVDAASAGDKVLVTDGIYKFGGHWASPDLTQNRVVLTKAIALESLNGPASTIIKGATWGDGYPVRGAYLASGASLLGFTLTGGAADLNSYGSGGGARCESSSSVISNCVIVGNFGYFYAGGVYGGTLTDCVISNNSAFGEAGGAYGAVLNNCTLSYNYVTSAQWGGGADSCTLIGCTLLRNSAPRGAGAFNCTLTNCILTENQAVVGGGMYGGTAHNCTFIGNVAGTNVGGPYGGAGAYNATIANSLFVGNISTAPGGGMSLCSATNCTIVGNSATAYGGGAYNCDVRNSILYYNKAPSSPNSFGSTINYCCTTPTVTNGTGNIDSDPQMASTSHLSSSSPCRAIASANYAFGVDIDGEAWNNQPSIGCDEYDASKITGPLLVSIQAGFQGTSPGRPLNFIADINGRPTDSRWDFGDGTVITNQPFVSHAWSSEGDYSLVLTAYNETNPNGVRSSITIHILSNAVHYVSLNSTNPVTPYFSWGTAATNIQDAVDAALEGAKVVVNDGTYNVGGRAVSGILMNRVAITKPILLQSVNGPSFTVVQGYQPTNGSPYSSVRCVYLTNGATLVGFTVTNGAAVGLHGDGGGIWCESVSASISNCVLSGNVGFYGGGALGGKFDRCIISGNSGALGGGVAGAVMNNCVFTNNVANGAGGGAYSSILTNCLLVRNFSNYPYPAEGGGGASYSSLYNCVLISNSASFDGGGAHSGTLNNCTLVANAATNSSGGAYSANLNNCILFYNEAPVTPDYTTGTQYYNSILNHCCTTILPPGGSGNITNEPNFVNFTNGDLHLQSNSPCINAGNNAYVTNTTDLDGNPRIVGGTVDIGAYEFQQPTSIISYAWLQEYGFPTDGSTDYTDPDQDGMNNWQEWIAGTDPTNAASALKMLAPSNSPSGVAVSWLSVPDRNYAILRSTNLPTFVTLTTNITGQTNTTTYVDTNSVGTGPFFYRVGILGTP